MKVLLFGRGGHLGSELVAQAPPGVELVALARADADLRDPSAVARAVERAAPAWVLNAAAWANVDAAEREREAARAVNALAVERLGQACAAHGARMLHFSTDYVFPGGARDYVETDPVAPVNWYGATKAEGEQRLLNALPDAIIARIQWLFSARRPCFVRLMRERARQGFPTAVVSDQVGRPSHVTDVARAAWSLLRVGQPGIFHVTSEGPPASRYEIAHRIFAAAGAGHLLTSCSSAEQPTPALRPARCVLANDRFRLAVGAALPDWREPIDRFAAE